MSSTGPPPDASRDPAPGRVAGAAGTGDAATAHDLLDAAHALVRAARRSAGPGVRGDVTGAQMDLLRVVRARPGAGVAEVAGELGLARNTTSTLVTQLVAAGLLVRAADPDDARSARLHLRPEAAERMAAWRARRQRAVEAALAVLDERERAAVVAALAPIARVAAAATAPADRSVER